MLLTVGPQQWPDLRELYAQLTQDLQWKVRQTLSHSLHEVAKIIGTQSTECDLLPTFELFLKDLDQARARPFHPSFVPLAYMLAGEAWCGAPSRQVPGGSVAGDTGVIHRDDRGDTERECELAIP